MHVSMFICSIFWLLVLYKSKFDFTVTVGKATVADTPVSGKITSVQLNVGAAGRERMLLFNGEGIELS